MPWILPSRGNPEQCAATLASVRNAYCSTHGVVIVNGDDQREAYIKAAVEGDHLPTNWVMQFNKVDLGFSGALNDFFAKHPNENWYGVLSDQDLIKTEGWDQELVHEADNWFMAHADDGWGGGGYVSKGTPVIGGELARAVGSLAVPRSYYRMGFTTMWEKLNEYLKFQRYAPKARIEYQFVSVKNQVAEFDDEDLCADWMQDNLFGLVRRIRRLRKW